MIITKTINAVKEGELKIYDEMTVDFANKKIIIGAFFEGETYSCQATFEEVLTGYTAAQKLALNNFFKKAKRIALNNDINPDADLIDDDIVDDFE